MSPTKKITVNDVEITISQQANREDYICLTDMVKDREGEDHIRNWMRNRNTIEFLGTWEIINNPNFKGVEFDTFMNEAGANRFNMTPRKWIEATNAIGIISKWVVTAALMLIKTSRLNLDRGLARHSNYT